MVVEHFLGTELRHISLSGAFGIVYISTDSHLVWSGDIAALACDVKHAALAAIEDFKLGRAMSNATIEDLKIVIHTKIYTFMSSWQRSFRKTQLSQIVA